MGKLGRIGVGVDYSAASKSAVRWAIDKLVGAGDSGDVIIILVHVLSPKSDPINKQLFEDTGSPLIPLEELNDMNVCKKYGLTPDPEVLDILNAASMTKGVEVAAKIYWGDPREKLCDSVENLKFDVLVLGSRGLGLVQRLLLGSVSTYVVQNAACPVTVVKTPPAAAKP
ncbi:universal stress protein A-like protein [Diospyros lotus]|uniref:universal stress protein A-like protein n=1 Tax=Diospyros lotus TaxID=55363 RepID=UPI00224F1117|nr:universal stress protein A-like protein [Diospyros lotus]